MKRVLGSLFAAGLLAGMCLAQSAVQSQASGSAAQETSAAAGQSGAQAESNATATASQATKVSGKDNHVPATGASQLQAGSTVQAELVKPIDAHKNKVGDEVVAKTTHDVKSDGRVVVPKGSKLIGHVTEAKAHSKEQATSELGVAFDRAVLKNGTEMAVAFGIQAIGRSQATAPAAEGDLTASGSAGGMASPGGRSSGGGALGSVNSTAGGVVSTASSTAGAAVNTAGSAGGAVSGSLSSTSQGVVGMPGLMLSTQGSASAQGSVISSSSGNVHLDSGTELILRVNQ
jgi:hypothetical protein